MSQLALLPRLLGNLLYEYPDSERNQVIIGQCEQIKVLFDWKEQSTIDSLINALENAKQDLNHYSFSVLFEGQGKMVAPPWGSVYQTVDNTIMGDSTDAFHRFLDQIGMDVDLHRQPGDHIAIMFWAMASLLEAEQDDELMILLEQHMLPWAYRYFELLAENDQSVFYATLAQMCTVFLKQIEEELQLTPNRVKLFM